MTTHGFVELTSSSTKSLIDRVYSESLKNKSIADDYFKSRGLFNRPNAGALLAPIDRIPGHTIIIPVHDVEFRLTGLIIRGIYDKFHYKVNRGNLLYNVVNAISNMDEVYVTEGVFDAEELIQKHNKNAIATLGASVNQVNQHLLACWSRIVLALDNDSAGCKSANKLIDFYLQNYPHVDIDTLDYEGKDLNSNIGITML